MKRCLSLVAWSAIGPVLAWNQLPGPTTMSRTSGSGFSMQQSFRDAAVIVIGEIAGGRAIDTGDKVQCRVAVRAERSLKGSVAPGSDVTVAWEYTPAGEPPEVTSQVPRSYGLWLLRAGPGGTYTPLRLTMLPRTMGGFYLPLPRVRLSADYDYPPGAPPDEKLARELGAVLERLATAEGDKLNPERSIGPGGGISMRMSPVQPAFQQINALLTLADPGAARPVYQRFAASELANLRILGLAGLMRAGEASAALALEKDVAQLAPTLEAMTLSQSLDKLDLAKNPAAMHALARAALTDTEIPGLEGAVAMRLGWVKRLDAMPYLMAMLGSPNASTRGAALMSVCTAARPGGGSPELAGLWREEMSGYCFNRSPVNDPLREQVAVQFWQNWWQGQRERVGNAVMLPEVRPPARYQAPPPPDAPVAVEVPMEQRLRSLVSMTTSFLQHPPGGSRPRSPLAAQLTPEDDAIFLQLAQKVKAGMDEIDQRARKTMNDARIEGRRPDIGQMRRFNDEQNAVLREGLDDLRRQLSPPGWAGVERHMKEMAIHGMRVGGPATARPRP